MNIASAVDTLAVARDLEAADIGRRQAEAIAGAMHRVAGATDDALATKADLAELRSELKAEFKADLTAFEGRLKNELKADLTELRSELKTEFKADLTALEGRLKTELKADLTALEARLMRFYFGASIAQIAVIVGLLKLL